MECSQRGGTADGTCAAGYGTCCAFLQSCGTFVRENRTLFVNNNYPDAYDGIGTCQITMQKINSDICQYRLDFDEFLLAGPETENHICENDQLIIAGAPGSVPIICGMNRGNHIYVDAGTDPQNSMVLSVVTNGESFNRTWKIRISQIPCSSNYKADEGCLQYFSSVSGQITSFNYDPTEGLQLSNQNYGICIRQDRNFCGVQYTQCPDPDNDPIQSFTLSGNSNSNVPAMVGSTGSSNFCQSDYLIIPMVSNVGRPPSGPSANVDRICGGILSADVTLIPTTVRSGVKPFRLWFHTDGVEAPTDRDNKGFCLNYVQQPCMSSI
ncbi:uncharacterized protein LOC123672031 [Harmonia axyridis]|uniref:uncharacterized protein LOC123672031 n=1 Tax=Harmonia axyridis TaxID=115357 RepID=UPI001E2780CC|nr:uncharacterized protein LOC123672031 [Harmonia axyridis]